LMFFFYSAHNVLILKKNLFKYTLLGALSGWIIFNSKAYVLLTFIPPLLLWLYLIKVKSVQNSVLGIFVGFFLLIILSAAGYFAFVNMANASEKYALNKLEKRIEGFQGYHNYLAEKGISKSGYHLEIESFSPLGILKVVPAAVNVSLFRPYLWESRSPLILISALESTVALIFFLRLIWRFGFLSLIRYLKTPEVALGILYAIILGTACGITAFNFGALVRFKIPLLPFFFSAMLIIQHLSMVKKDQNRKALPGPLPVSGPELPIPG
jgi:hypothetical protein